LLFAPIRFVSIHLCANDTLLTNLSKAVLTARLNTDYRMRLICNLGEGVEVRYSLQGYGIPIDSLPVTLSGAIKTVNFKRFINFRHYVENERKDDDCLFSQKKTSIVTDCPYLNDILFKKGHPAEHQPGNIQFRSIIHSVYTMHLQHQHHHHHQQQQQQLRSISTSSSSSSSSSLSSLSSSSSSFSSLSSSSSSYHHFRPPVSVSVKMLVPDIIRRIEQENLRVLVWNNKNNWWDYLSDHIDYKKHIYASAHFFLKNNVVISSLITTPTAKSKSKSKSKSKPAAAATVTVTVTVVAPTPTTTVIVSNQKRVREQQVIESSTPILISQDSKKQKMSFGSDSDSDSDISPLECFGLPFQCISCLNNDNDN
jgi:hypothetical protein